MKKKIIIFGGSGFIGSHLTDILYNQKFDVTVFDVFKNDTFNKNIKFIKGDIQDKKKIFKITKKYEYIFNFAGISDISKANVDPISTINNNFIGTVNILEAIKYQKKVKRFVFASSIYAMSSQGGFYSSTKRSSENIIENYSKKFGIKYSILRYGSIYGARSNRDNAIYDSIYQGIKRKKIVRKGVGNEIRSYINVKDAAKITLEILNRKFENKYVNIIGKNKIKVKNVLNLISKKLNHKKIFYKKNEKLNYHYNKNPYNYKITQGIEIKPNNPINLSLGIDEIIKEILINKK